MSELLLELYHDAADCGADELRLRMLKNLQKFLPFDFAVWGGGWADGRLVTDLTVLNQNEGILEDWHAVAHADEFCDITLENLGFTARFDDVPDYRKSMAYNEHWRPFDAVHMMATIVAEKTDGYVSFVGLCADKRSQPFTNSDRNFKQHLMPHLSQALRMNRDFLASGANLGREGIAVINCEGHILSVGGGFREIFMNEWGKPVRHIPPAVMHAFTQGRQWFGETLNAHLSPFENNFLVHLSIVTALERLSPREREVAELSASGLTYKDVARHLGTSPSTVRNQIARIYEKLDVSSKAELTSLIGQNRL